jgi:hypothetical protein
VHWQSAFWPPRIRRSAHAAPAQVGPLYVLASAAALIFVNLGTRKPGEASAYSVFNDFRELPGQLNAAAMDDQLRRGQL